MCAIEDGEASRHALRAATWLTRELHATLVVAHAFDPLSVGALPRGEMIERDITDDDVERAARVVARRLLEHAAHTVTGIDVKTLFAEGEVVSELRGLAAQQGAALLVAGTAARVGLDRMLIGSVSGELAASAPCPVVAVPRGAALEEPGAVLAGYDGSAHSLRAARRAAALAARLGRELVLVHVTGRDRVEVNEELAGELHAAGVRALGEDPRRPALDLTVRLAVEEGDPVEVLAAVARERRAALLVTGTRGRNALSSALLGSVSVGLVRAARRPVALVSAAADETPVGR
jgi:nucleotide-binding universal stress UspA family protein